jgi:hypothetical protein
MTSRRTQLKDQPVGAGDHIVQRGECMASIADASGHFWEKLWGLAENADLKAARKDPNALLPGDRVHVPPIEEKEESRPTTERHTFRRKGVPSKIRIRCMHRDEPLAGKDYRLDIDGELFSGKTDDQGWVEHAIIPGARYGKLIVTDGQREHEYILDVGAMDPINTTTGIKARLANLGFLPGKVDASDSPEFRTALKEFQDAYGLEPSGEPDKKTQDKLLEFSAS